MPIELREEDIWPLLIATVRYSLGRRSYMPAVCAGLVRRYGRYLEPWQRRQISEEIRAFDFEPYDNGSHGWIELSAWLEA